MKKCKKILLLLNFFALLLPLSLNASAFSEVDLQRLLKNHPIMKNYQPETGRFLNTPSEIQPIEKIKVVISSLTSRIELLESEKKRKLSDHFSTESSGEESLWQSLKGKDSEIESAAKEIKHLKELSAAGGIPGFETVLKISEEIWKDIYSELVGLRGVVVNNLPVNPPGIPPNINNNDLRRFFYSPLPESLTAYTKFSIEIGFLFRTSSKTIIYQKGK